MSILSEKNKCHYVFEAVVVAAGQHVSRQHQPLNRRRTGPKTT